MCGREGEQGELQSVSPKKTYRRRRQSEDEWRGALSERKRKTGMFYFVVFIKSATKDTKLENCKDIGRPGLPHTAVKAQGSDTTHPAPDSNSKTQKTPTTPVAMGTPALGGRFHPQRLPGAAV